jgi:hypothetical protein
MMGAMIKVDKQNEETCNHKVHRVI